jgi:processing peptidase subunit beta
MDQMHAVAYDPSVSGLPFTILGPSENISKTINRQSVVDFVKTHYTAPRMMLISSGGISPDQLLKYADKYFSALPSHSTRPAVKSRYVGGHSILWNTSMMTTHAAWAFPTCGAQHPDSIPLQLLHNLVGRYSNEAPDMFRFQRFNSTRRHRANLELIRPFYTPYEDTGVLGYQIVTSLPADGNPASDAQTVVLDDILTALYGMCHKPPSEELLSDAKADFKAGRLISLDSTTNTCEDLGRQMVHFGRRVEPTEFIESIDAVTPAMITDVLQRYLVPVRPSLSVIGHPAAAPSLDVADGVKYKSG